jgi:hypothetical protein
MRFWLRIVVVLAVAAMGNAAAALAQDGGARTEIYGYVMMDAGKNREAVDPNWFDVQRPTKLASFENEFGRKGDVFFSARQTRLGVKSFFPTDMGELKTTFEFELFGTGADAGQTTFRLRHAYGELGKFGAGQTWSPFMDIDVFPNTLEYWGPNGMVFFRNVQLRYMPIQGDTRMTIALERPGASGDGGDLTDRLDLGSVQAHFPLPDLSAEYRIGRPWGYVELAGILRQMEWDDLGTDTLDISGDAMGWGFNLSSNLKLGAANVLRLQLVHGEGIENYMNDAPADLALEIDPNDAQNPVDGKPLPVTGTVAFLDHTWSPKFSSSIGYSQAIIENSNGQSPDAFHLGQYALANLLYTPVPKVMMGIETGWTHRANNSDGFTADNVHVQVSFKYSFSAILGGSQ